MTGRVDYAGEQAGYGHINGYKLQFELISVSELTGKTLVRGTILKSSAQIQYICPRDTLRVGSLRPIEI
jgi:hypothetical protein